MANLFAKAKEKEQPKSSKGKMKTVVPVSLGDKIKQVNDLRDEAERIKTKLAIVEDDVKTEGKAQFLTLFKNQRVKPESFVMESEGARILMIVQDKYEKLTPEKEAILNTCYGSNVPDLVTETTEFKFNPILMEKYADILGEKLSEAIMGIEGIPEADKENLIVSTTVKTIKKGVLGQLLTFENPGTLMDLVKPVLQLKNSKED